MTGQSILNIPFKTIQDATLHLDLLYPDNRATPYPVIIYLHGGGWVWGSRHGRPVVRLVDDYLRDNGFVIVPIDYRLSGVATYPAQLEDCQAAVRWLRANAEQYRLSPERIGVWGFSSGAQLGALLGLIDAGTDSIENGEFSSTVQAVCAFAVTSDFLSLDTVTDEEHPVAKLFGGLPVKQTGLAKHASPINHVGTNAAAFYLIHGDKDSVVPVQQSEILHEALEQAGVNSTLHVIPGGDHGMAGLDDATIQHILDNALTFFQKHL